MLSRIFIRLNAQGLIAANNNDKNVNIIYNSAMPYIIVLTFHMQHKKYTLKILKGCILLYGIQKIII